MNTDIGHIALENLRQTTDIQGVWKDKGLLDGGCEMVINDQKTGFVVEVKTTVRPHQIHKIEENHQQFENYLLIANQIFPKVKAALRQKEISYLESNGNVFIKKESIYLYVETKKKSNNEIEKGNRAFTKTGLKVVFYLLQQKHYVNQTHREIAENVGVGLGNIPQVFAGLKETGYLIPLNKKEYVWDRKNELIERWVTAYATVLKPKLRKGRFTFRGNWKELQLNQARSVWGGEPAADILTNYLRPEKLTLYTSENHINLMQKYRLIPDQTGEVEVFEMFWKQNDHQPTVPALLIYADLQLEGGKRNKELAQRIYNEYIEPNL